MPYTYLTRQSCELCRSLHMNTETHFILFINLKTEHACSSKHKASQGSFLHTQESWRCAVRRPLTRRCSPANRINGLSWFSFGNNWVELIGRWSPCLRVLRTLSEPETHIRSEQLPEVVQAPGLYSSAPTGEQRPYTSFAYIFLLLDR